MTDSNGYRDDQSKVKELIGRLPESIVDLKPVGKFFVGNLDHAKRAQVADFLRSDLDSASFSQTLNQRSVDSNNLLDTLWELTFDSESTCDTGNNDDWFQIVDTEPERTREHRFEVSELNLESIRRSIAEILRSPHAQMHYVSSTGSPWWLKKLAELVMNGDASHYVSIISQCLKCPGDAIIVKAAIESGDPAFAKQPKWFSTLIKVLASS